MRDIKDYFGSPVKTNEDKSVQIIEETKEVVLGRGLNKSKFQEQTEKIQPENDVNISEKAVKNRKKSKLRKPSDHLVKNGKDMLSNTLNMISQKNDEEYKKEHLVEQVQYWDSCSTSDSYVKGNCDIVSGSNSKLNAFQLLMDSRNKSIGTNSPGKEIEYQEPEDMTFIKQKLATRKNLLNDWAEKKGASKRKREEKAIEETIHFKLGKRAKRLKKLLNVENNEKVIKRKKKRIKRISFSTDSEVSTESTNIVVCKSNASTQDILKSSKSKKELLNFSAIPKILKKDAIKNNKSKKNDSPKNEQECVPTIKGHKKNKDIDRQDTEISECINMDLTDNNPVESSKIPKNKSRKKMKLKNVQDNGESSHNRILTPSTKYWKMKICINLDEDNNPPAHNLFPSDEKHITALKNPVNILSDSEDDFAKQTPKINSRKALKIAPVFIKAPTKPRIDAETLEARKQFLMSGIPSSLREAIEKQRSLEEKEYNVFPNISHVQQKCNGKLWSLPQPELNIKNFCPLIKEEIKLSCQGIISSHINLELNIQNETKKITQLKFVLNKIKEDNPDYPVYKSFRLLYEKSGKHLKKFGQKHKKIKQNQKITNTSIEVENPDKKITDQAIWTEKYKPKCTDDIIGNTESIRTLKKWLINWMNFSQEINVKQSRNSSSSDFEISDCDSKDTIRLPSNALVLEGPCGSGKTAAVYAIGNELGLNIIELNASCKRTGKKLIQDLQEATQSHQVRKGEPYNFFQNANKQEADYEKKMCVLFIEDVDIVFEQDEGFVSALTQLLATSKRPIILTTTDYESAFLQKFLSQYEYITFYPLSSYSLATWLQVLCLVEGSFINRNDLGDLLDFNKGDIRKTLLQLQFWVQSGGDLAANQMTVKIKCEPLSTEEKLVDNEEINVFICDENVFEVFIHRNCIRSFEIFENYIPYYLDMGLLWWNIPNFLDLKTQSKSYLNMLVKFYGSTCFADVSLRKINYVKSEEPTTNNINSKVRDSVELKEKMESIEDFEFVHEITHSLVNGYIRECNQMSGKEPNLNIAVPNRPEKKYRTKKYLYEEVFGEALNYSTRLHRKALALDYLPILRTMSRSESRRAANNTKRGNRFRNYLKDLGIKCNDKVVKIANEIFLRDLNFR